MALCHEWLRSRSGSEKTFERIAQTFPSADLYALTRNPAIEFSLGGRPVHTTFIDQLAPLRQRHALQLPLMPLAWRYASRKSYDLVITSSHACVKGFWPARKALHLCYCYTPMRYVWLSSLDQRRTRDHLSRFGESVLRQWDLSSVAWVDEFAAISTEVQARIERFYGRPSRVIHPPVDTAFYSPDETLEKAGFVLAVSRMVPYKRLDLAIKACGALGVPLVIAGAGPQETVLRELAGRSKASVEFVIHPSDEVLRKLYREAEALIFPAEEDFGIVAVEAQACGTPVLALGKGGSLDTVVDGETGVLVPEQTEEEMTAGLETLLGSRPAASRCRHNAERFSAQRFSEELIDWVSRCVADRGDACTV